MTVAVSRVDGGVTVMRVVVREYVPTQGGGRAVHREYDPTPAYVESLIAKYVTDGHWIGGLAPVGWEFVPNDYLDENTDPYFRDAWKHAPGRGKPDVDMVKAREIHRGRLRRMRAPLLEELDVEYMKASERGDAAAQHDIAAQKRALRDVTADPAIEGAQTPEELKAVIPEAVLGRPISS